MYESFYGLKERPFSLLPDPDYLYLSPKHMRALTLLEYGMMNQAGFSVICGDTGAGKTTLIRRLLTELGEDTTVGLITNTHKSFGELLSWVLMAFGIDGENKSKAQMHQLLIEFLIDQYARNHRTVLIVDEAQNMTADTLEELRMLSNINADKDQVLQVILAGQPALRETLRKPELMQFAQRIAVDYYLESLNRDETHEYIQHRLEVAGGDPATFTEAACHAVFRYSGGTPRLINLLCDTALVYGFAEQTRVIDAPLVEDVVREQHRNSIVPTFSKPQPEDISSDQAQPERKTKSASTNLETDTVQSVTDAQFVKAAEVSLMAAEQELASLAQKAASDYTTASNIGHADHQSSAIVSDTAPVNRPNINVETASHSGEPSVSSNVTRIKKTTTKSEPADNTESDTAQAVNSKSATDSKTTDQPAQPKAHKSEQKMAEPVEQEDLEPKFDAEDTKERTHYKDVYPIVHIADEPRKNLNIMILGFAGGVLLTAIIMVAMMWMLFRNQAPAIVNAPVAAAPATEITPSPEISAAEQARVEAIQKERDNAMAEAETLKRERDAAMLAAQKQEAMRAAEKRANEIMAEQERKYTVEMERIRQRAFDAELSAAKARERERLASEEAERARLEASRISAATVTAPQPTASVTPQPVIATTQRTEAPEQKPVPTKTTTPSDETAGSNSQFSANPCNSPSAKFLSTCKK